MSSETRKQSFKKAFWALLGHWPLFNIKESDKARKVTRQSLLDGVGQRISYPCVQGGGWGTGRDSSICQLRVPWFFCSRPHFIQIHTHHMSKPRSSPQLVRWIIFPTPWFLRRTRMVVGTVVSPTMAEIQSGASSGKTTLSTWLPGLFSLFPRTHSQQGMLRDKNAAQGSFWPAPSWQGRRRREALVPTPFPPSWGEAALPEGMGCRQGQPHNCKKS